MNNDKTSKKDGGTMYTLKEIIDYTHTLFRTNKFDSYNNECGVTFDAANPIKTIGYCTNLTPDSIEKAKESNIDLLITHHDAWEFIYGMKEECDNKLKEYGISHFFIHLPLDDAPFGTNSSLLYVLGLKECGKYSEEEGYLCGALGRYDEPISFGELISRLESKMGEPVMSWQNNNRLIKSVFVVCGAGFTTDLMKEAVDLKADVYITGEKVLYTMQYAKQKDLNLIIGSHTFTEIFGVESLVKLLKNRFIDLDIKLISEERLEAKPLMFK